jgi:membrane protein
MFEKKFIKRLRFKTAIRLRKVTLPGFDRVPLYDVITFFWKSLYDGALSLRASSVAFSFFLALFPAIIFIFTLIPYIPIANFQVELLKLLQNLMPVNAYKAIEFTMEDIAMHKRGSLLSFGFIAALIFSTNGIAALISAFNATVLTFESRTWIWQRIISVFLVLIITLLITISIGLLVTSRKIFDILLEHNWLEKNFLFYLLQIGQWFIIFSLFFFAIAFLYFLAPAKKTKWRFISPGGSLATILMVVTSLGFSYYINNFGQYNKLYGSLGTLIVVLLWLYFNSFVLIIGFELNASINNASLKKDGHFLFNNT